MTKLSCALPENDADWGVDLANPFVKCGICGRPNTHMALHEYRGNSLNVCDDCWATDWYGMDTCGCCAIYYELVLDTGRIERRARD